MLKLSSSRGIRIDVSVLFVSWSVVDHSVIIQALKKGLIEHEASDTGGVPRWKSSCPDRRAAATGLDVTERVAERGIKTKPAEGNFHPNEEKRKKSEPVLKEDVGTRNKDRRGTKTNVEEVGKTTSEDKTDTKTQV